MSAALMRPMPQQGLTLVEVLMGVALSLLLLTPLLQAAALQWTGQRQWAHDLKLQQSLRTAADALSRDVRRAGAWVHADRAAAGVVNPYAAVQLTDGGSLGDSIAYAYAHPKRSDDDTLTDDERMGWRLRNGIIESQLGLGNWQALTDPSVVRITQFRLSTQTETLPLPCARTCGSTASSGADAGPCPPVQVMRTLWIDLSGQLATQGPSTSSAPSGPQRSLRTSVRLRNDTWAGTCRD